MPRKKTKKQAKAKKNDELLQTHGKTESTRHSTLDQVWGDTGESRYGTMDLEEYQGQLKTMNRTDIQAHATKLGVVPVENREMLEKRLTKEFQKHTNSYAKPDGKRPKEVSEEARRILSEGR